MERLSGRSAAPITAEGVVELCQPYKFVLVDLGTGDGSFVLREARRSPNKICLGIDAAADPMAEASRRALAKPARGGAPNAIFLVSSLENLPDNLTGLATELTIHFPWGSLLRTLIEPDMSLLRKIALLCRNGAAFTILINASIFKDDQYLERLSLEPLDAARFNDELRPLWQAIGFIVEKAAFDPAETMDRTTWGKRLVRGAKRETFYASGNFQIPDLD